MYLARYTNPKLTGTIVKEAVKCGRINCQCSKGYMHKWYYYLYYRSLENGKWKLKKEYIAHNRVRYLKAKIREFKKKDMRTKVRLSANIGFLKDVKQYTTGDMSNNDLLTKIYEIT